jgi:hypothetical protein
MDTWAGSMSDRSRVGKPRPSIRCTSPATSSSALMPMENRMCATFPAEYLWVCAVQGLIEADGMCYAFNMAAAGSS